jgi:hypothetical protein
MTTPSRVAPRFDLPRLWRLRLPSFRLLAALLLFGVATVTIPRVVDLPRGVRRVTFENPTPYDLEVDLTSAKRDGWILLGTAQARSVTTIEEVADQGRIWIFRFRGQGEDGGEIRVGRDELKDAEWTVTVPDRIARQLQARGASPPPE